MSLIDEQLARLAREHEERGEKRAAERAAAVAPQAEVAGVINFLNVSPIGPDEQDGLWRFNLCTDFAKPELVSLRRQSGNSTR